MLRRAGTALGRRCQGASSSSSSSRLGHHHHRHPPTGCTPASIVGLRAAAAAAAATSIHDGRCLFTTSTSSSSSSSPSILLQAARASGHHHHHYHRRPLHEQQRLLDALKRALSTQPPPVPPTKENEPAAAPVAKAEAAKPTAAGEEEEPKKKPTWKDMLKKHGPVFLVYWNGMWLLSGLSIYALLELGGVDPMPLAYWANLDRLIDLSRLDPAHGNIAVAIVLNEAAELVRFPFVIATVPRVTKWWERVRPDYFKPKLGPDGKPKPTFADQVKRHGPVFVVWWGTLWVAGAAGLFGAFEYHLFGDIDAMSLAYSINLHHFINLEAIPPSWGNLGVAVAFNEALEIVRFPLALATVPPITRWVERIRGVDKKE